MMKKQPHLTFRARSKRECCFTNSTLTRLGFHRRILNQLANVEKTTHFLIRHGFSSHLGRGLFNRSPRLFCRGQQLAISMAACNHEALKRTGMISPSRKPDSSTLLDFQVWKTWRNQMNCRTHPSLGWGVDQTYIYTKKNLCEICWQSKVGQDT